MFVFVFVVNPQ